MKGHTHAIEKVLFNPVRDFELASCASDGTIRFWDTRSKTCNTKLDVGGDAFTLAWSIDGSVLVAGTKVRRDDDDDDDQGLLPPVCHIITKSED